MAHVAATSTSAGRAPSPSSATTVRVTTWPASLISCTMLSWESSTMDCPFTAEMRSPTFSFPHWSAGLPSITRPILWGITAESEQAHQLFQSMVNIPVRRALSRARAPRSAQSRSCSERWRCSEKPVEDKGGLTQQSECRAKGLLYSCYPSTALPSELFWGVREVRNVVHVSGLSADFSEPRQQSWNTQSAATQD